MSECANVRERAIVGLHVGTKQQQKHKAVFMNMLPLFLLVCQMDTPNSAIK